MPFQKGHQHWKKRKDIVEKQVVVTEITIKPVEAVAEVKPEPEIIPEPVIIPPKVEPAPYKTEPNRKEILSQIQAVRRSVNRHCIGLEKALQDYQDQVATPLCVVCYVHYGYLSKCRCDKNIS